MTPIAKMAACNTFPGSHRWDLLSAPQLAGGMDSIREVLTAEQLAQFQPVAIELKKGECAFHHPLMIHGSYENRTDRPQRAVVVNAFHDGVRSGSDEPLLAGVPPIPAGQPMGGSFSRCRTSPSLFVKYLARVSLLAPSIEAVALRTCHAFLPN